MIKTFILPLSKVIHETPDAVTLVMNQPKVDRINYLPGQYVTLKVEIEEKTYWRSYSLSSTPRWDRHLAVTIKRIPGGRVSNYLNDHLQVGQMIEFLRPAGHFTIETSIKETRNIALIGAGSGITPLMSILKAVLFHEPKSKVALLYGNREAEQVIFLSNLKTLQRKFPQRFFLQHLLSNPKPGTPISFESGRIDQAKLSSWLQAMTANLGTIDAYYICGPTGMIETAVQHLKGRGIPTGKIHVEKFLASPEMEQRQTQAEGPTHRVRLHLGADSHEIRVPSGLSILTAALAQGISLPYSCRRGICSTCMSKLVRGRVEMNNPESLLEFEAKQGKVLTCQAHPLDDDVEIEIGIW
ncbi:MAG: ferredoxin--NADP reductase [Bacteroidota bacterium]